jgi:hypothetical protein
MSKKLIAVASAAALALSALVAMPAQAAAAWSVSVTDAANLDQSATASSSRTPAKNSSLEGNQLNPALLVTFSVDPTSTTSITVTASGGVRLVADGDEAAAEDAEVDYITVKDGKGSLPAKSLTSKSSNYVFYAYSTSTTAGKVEIKDGLGNVQNYWVASEVGTAYNIAATFPASVPVKVGTADLLVQITDIFGNALKGAANANEASYGGAGLTATVVGAQFMTASPATTINTWAWNKAKQLWAPYAASDFVGLQAAQAGPVVISLSLDSTDGDVGLVAPKNVAFKVLDSASLEDQIVKLQAIVDRKVSKKKYNTLARKWNRAFPSQKVALKK